VWTPPKATPKKGSKTKTPQTAAARNAIEVTRKAQQALNAAGYDVGAPDGHAGNMTVTALKRFQAARRLPVSGKFDEATLAELGVEGSDGGDQAGTLIVLSDAINALVQTVDPATQRPLLLAATNKGLYRSLDPTKGWEKLSSTSGLDPRTTCVATDLQNPETIWAGTASSGLLVTRDGGKLWQRVSGVPSEAPINAIALDIRRPNYLYVGTKQAFYRSQDGGATWSRRGGNLPFGDFTSILINPRNSDEIFVGNAYQTGEIGGGVYRTLNAGSTWARIDPKENRLPSQRIWALAFDSRDQNTLFVGSHSAGVYVVPRGSNGSLATSQ
jgi:ligand-binding sensor domain-containing protein